MNINRFLYLIFFCLGTNSCGNAFLDVKPSVSQKVPKTLEDFSGLMDKITVMNAKSCHELGIIGSDEIYIAEARYNAFPSNTLENWQIKSYTWEKEIYMGGEGANSNPLDWNTAYQRILWANLVLEGLAKISPEEGSEKEWNNAFGMALFHRALNFYNLAQLFCPVYQKGSADTDSGLPLRLEVDLTIHTPRASVGETYRQIIDDLLKAETMLPERPATLFRPGKNSVYALLARLHLQMKDYTSALGYASQCLGISSTLLDYNKIDLSLNPTFSPIGDANPEVIFISSAFLLTIFKNAYFNVDPILYQMYDDTDLRKGAFFTLTSIGSARFKGNYGIGDEYTSSFFTGIATDEVLLIRAECAARHGNARGALEDLNLLREHRFMTGSYHPLVSDNAGDVLNWVLEERRKELVLRGRRWEDLRRLNQEPGLSRILVRELGAQRFELLPNSPRYVWPIPLEAIKLGNYEQNLR